MEVRPQVQRHIVVDHQIEIFRNVIQSFCAMIGVEGTAGQRVVAGCNNWLTFCCLRKLIFQFAHEVELRGIVVENLVRVKQQQSECP